MHKTGENVIWKEMEKANIFKKGVVLKHKDKEGRGIVIDWGILSRECRRFKVAGKEAADSVRVWTKEGKIEVWPAEAVKTVEH